MSEYRYQLYKDIIMSLHNYHDIDILNTYNSVVKGIICVNFRYKESNLPFSRWSMDPITVNINISDIRDYKVGKLLS